MHIGDVVEKNQQYDLEERKMPFVAIRAEEKILMCGLAFTTAKNIRLVM